MGPEAHRHSLQRVGRGIGRERISMNARRRLRRPPRSEADQIEREAVGEQLQPQPTGGIGRIFSGVAIQRRIETYSESAPLLREISNRRRVRSAPRSE
jgi:hypothetical protein